MIARVLGWTMAEVRAHSVADIRAMTGALEREHRERERAERRARAHSESRRMSR